jgi:hypothetical protein
LGQVPLYFKTFGVKWLHKKPSLAHPCRVVQTP